MSSFTRTLQRSLKRKTHFHGRGSKLGVKFKPVKKPAIREGVKA